jgi:hypothetical protein
MRGPAWSVIMGILRPTLRKQGFWPFLFADWGVIEMIEIRSSAIRDFAV